MTPDQDLPNPICEQRDAPLPAPVVTGGTPRRFCSDGCRQAAYRARRYDAETASITGNTEWELAATLEAERIDDEINQSYFSTGPPVPPSRDWWSGR